MTSLSYESENQFRKAACTNFTSTCSSITNLFLSIQNIQKDSEIIRQIFLSYCHMDAESKAAYFFKRAIPEKQLELN